MKKLFLIISLIISALLLFGCTPKQQIKSSFSEITYLFYYGEDASKGICLSISVGEREQPYIIDGNHTDNVDFSLVTLSFSQKQTFNKISVNIDDSEILLEFNPLNNSYMGDLGYKIENENISCIVEENAIILQKISDNFAVDYNQATQIAISALGESLNSYHSNGNFQGECYLKILKEEENNSTLFWIFTVIGRQGQSNNVVIDTNSGEVVILN